MLMAKQICGIAARGLLTLEPINLDYKQAIYVYSRGHKSNTVPESAFNAGDLFAYLDITFPYRWGKT